MKIKETVYGLYPSAKDMYISSQDAADSYRNECLYKHYNSRYNDKPGSGTPIPPTSVKMQLSQRKTPTRMTPATGERRVTSSTSDIYKASPGERCVSVTSCRSLRAESAQSVQGGGGQAWVTRASPGPPVHSPAPHSPAPHSVTSRPPSHSLTQTPRPPSQSTGSRPERVRSAAYSRPRHAPPRRDVKSAGPSREGSRPVAPIPPTATPGSYSTPGVQGDLRPDLTPSPEPLDYDDQLRKHGWRMEVPGDPLDLKRPCFAKRKAYSVSVKIPSVLPRPPKCYMENFDTFFSNTIPAKPATYTIHPEWMSEILFAKRLELQKREGYKYKHNDFSFIY